MHVVRVRARFLPSHLETSPLDFARCCFRTGVSRRFGFPPPPPPGNTDALKTREVFSVIIFVLLKWWESKNEVWRYGFKPTHGHHQRGESNMELQTVLLTTGASVGFFRLINRALELLYVPETAQRNIWKWRNISTSFIHSLITGIWAVLWWVHSAHT